MIKAWQDEAWEDYSDEAAILLTQEKIREVVRDVAPKYELKGGYLFGSYARGDATEGSDFDFRIVGGNLRSLYDLAALRLDLEDALGKPVDVVLTRNIDESFYEAIKNDEVLLYEAMLQ
jgi:predicted nucleotidyltransferase